MSSLRRNGDNCSTSPCFFSLACGGARLVAVQLAGVAVCLLSLTVVRMLPVAIALIGTRLSAASVIFMGWFGPRGLASIVLGLVYLEQEMHCRGRNHPIRGDRNRGA